MAIWPFRRRSERKRTRSGAALSDVESPAAARNDTNGAVTRAISIKKQRTGPEKLQRRARNYSFSPDRQDDLGAVRRASTERRAQRNHDIAESDWERTPTLHHKSTARRPNRRKSSKRKREDQDRAAEIKAMSNFVPVRPAAEDWTMGRPMKKDSKRVKTGGFGRQEPSDVSLPIPGSVHSSLSSDNELASFKVSALDALAPRPTLRYAPGSRGTPVRNSTQSTTQKRPLAEKTPIRDQTLKENKRIDHLADDLDAGDLRELMEREDRRRERKKLREQERAERRLARKAEQQRLDEIEHRVAGTPPPENLERGVAGRELVGLGIEPASAVVTSAKQREPETVPEGTETGATLEEEKFRKPLDTFHRTNSIPLESATPDLPEAIPEDEAVEARPHESTTSLNQGSRLAGLLRSKKSKSRSTLDSEREKATSPSYGRIDEGDSMRKSSVGSSRRGRFSLTSFLRWGGNNRRHSGGPSSFSNTSREEMYAAGTAPTVAQAQAQALARLQGDDVSPASESPGVVYVSRKPSTATTRLRSRFREDLPEFPMSPPDSRVQSPEIESPLPIVVEQPANHVSSQPIPIAVPAGRRGTVTSDHRHTPISMDGNFAMDPHQSVSMSLASIDSEASWLSGRVGARRSAMPDSLSQGATLPEPPPSDSPTNSTQEDLAIADDDYLSRLAPRNSAQFASRRSGEGRPSSDEEDFGDEASPIWGAVSGARPYVVNHRSTMMSHEGLLNIESEDEDSSGSRESLAEREKAQVRRARSVNLGQSGHIRNFSAGSARLLDLTPRSSVDGKARSRERRNSVPLA